ncbi:MAG: DUF1460 domain-containing protein [Verrucomicrobia bacterium]|nr:DUF1460 domain-containing protein [Verrucomicrobiota bacterium]
MRSLGFFLSVLVITLVQGRSTTLPFSTIFRGESVFNRLIERAKEEHWRDLPLGDRTVAVGKALLGTPYVNFTLEIDDHVEAASADLYGMDCWTFFEISLAFARMLDIKSDNYSPRDLLALIELDRYRDGRCNGSYTSRLHFLEDWAYDNERRGLVRNVTRSLGAVLMRGRYLNEMSKTWRSSRYLRNNPQLISQIRQIEYRVSSRDVYQIPKDRVAFVQSKIRNGDVICITGQGPEGFTEHVGLAYRDGSGVLRFMHASKDRREVMIDVPLQNYLYRYRKFAGIIVVRPLEVRGQAAA